MESKDLWKALELGFELWLFYLISTSILGWSPDSGPFLGRIGAWVIILLCLYVFIRTEYKRLHNPKPKVYKDVELPNIKEAKKAVDRTVPKAFKKEMRTLDTQISRMNHKKEALDSALKGYFGDSKISYEKFASTVGGVEGVFLDNVQRVINRVNIFDEEGYEDVFNKHLEYTSAIAPYNEHFRYVKGKLDENEEILKKMDRLLLEVSNLNENKRPIEEMPVMQEMSELIDQTRLYKH